MFENKTLTTSILEHLRKQIITCQLKSGHRVNEYKLSLELNVSRPPLREAFQILEQESSIISISRKGRYITEISRKNYENTHESRRMMECYVIDCLKAKNVRDLPVIEGVLAKVGDSTMPKDGPFEKLYHRDA